MGARGWRVPWRGVRRGLAEASFLERVPRRQIRGRLLCGNWRFLVIKIHFFAFSRICIAMGEPWSCASVGLGHVWRMGHLLSPSRLLFSSWTSGARPDLLFHLRADKGQRSLVMACNGRTVREHRVPIHFTSLPVLYAHCPSHTNDLGWACTH